MYFAYTKYHIMHYYWHNQHDQHSEKGCSCNEKSAYKCHVSSESLLTGDSLPGHIHSRYNHVLSRQLPSLSHLIRTYPLSNALSRHLKMSTAANEDKYSLLVAAYLADSKRTCCLPNDSESPQNSRLELGLYLKYRANAPWRAPLALIRDILAINTYTNTIINTFTPGMNSLPEHIHSRDELAPTTHSFIHSRTAFTPRTRSFPRRLLSRDTWIQSQDLGFP